jgi:5-oxoprolinase (ATP-hydrolysing)
MSADGGLRPAQKYTGNAALLSGPAGGVVGVAKSCYDLKDPKAIIGFDMVSFSQFIFRQAFILTNMQGWDKYRCLPL